MRSIVFLLSLVFYLSRTNVDSVKPAPYLAIVRKSSNHAEWCTATIIGNRCVITAANCAHSRYRYIVQVGKLDRKYDVQNVIIHESWDRNRGTGIDLALFNLATSLQFNKYVRPIALARKNPPFNSSVRTLIWSGQNMQAIEGVYLSAKDCHAHKPLSNEICVRTKYTSRQGVCNRDRGAPLVGHNVLIGVVSSVGPSRLPSCAGNSSDIYASTVYNLNWINKHMTSSKNVLYDQSDENKS